MVEATKVYKKVLILGPGIDKAKALKQFNFDIASEDHKVIGDGVNDINRTKLGGLLKGKIDQNTIIVLYAHGTVDEVGHSVQIARTSLFQTGMILSVLNDASSSPLHIILASCYGGAANNDIKSLKEGSVLITHTDPHNPHVFHDINAKYLSKYLDRKNLSPEQMFIDNFYLYSSVSSINIKIPNNQYFTFTVTPFKTTLDEVYDGLKNYCSSLIKPDQPIEEEMIGQIFLDTYQSLVLYNVSAAEEFAKSLPHFIISESESLLYNEALLRPVTVKILSQQNVNLDSQNYYGRTALMETRKIANVRSLLEEGASTKILDKLGMNALFNHIEHNNSDDDLEGIIKLLLDADPYSVCLINNEGHNAKKHSRINGVKGKAKELIEEQYDKQGCAEAALYTNCDEVNHGAAGDVISKTVEL